MVTPKNATRTPPNFLLLAGILAVFGGCTSTDAMLAFGRIDHHVTAAGANGCRIEAWVINARDADGRPIAGPHPTAVLLHPWLADKTWFLPLGEELSRHGWNVILPDLRGHGDSRAGATTWGALERRDVKDVVDACVARGFTSDEIYAFGASLGGCVALLYAVDDPRCRGVVAVVPVDGLRGFIDQANPLADARARTFLMQEQARMHGYAAAEADPTAAGARAKIPLRLIWGQFDTIVPSEQTSRIFEAWGGPKEREMRPSDHVGIQLHQDGYFVQQLEVVRRMAARIQ